MQGNDKQAQDISSKQSSKNQNDKQDDKNNSNTKANTKDSMFKQCKQEFKQITWPTKPILAKHTITVIVFSLVMGSITFVYDFGIDSFLGKLAELVF